MQNMSFIRKCAASDGGTLRARSASAICPNSSATCSVTVSGVSTSLSEEASRQRQVLEQIEYDMSQLGPADDYAGAARRMRTAIDELMNGLGEWGVVLSGEETRRLANVAHALAGWARSYEFERWSLGLEARLLRSSTSEI